MSDVSGNQPIRARMLAEKLASVRNFEHENVLEQIISEPRLVEVLWFLQWVSRPENYPGGLRKFAIEFAEASKDLIGSLAMKQAGNGPFSEETVRAIYHGAPYTSGGKWNDIPSGLFDEDVERWEVIARILPRESLRDLLDTDDAARFEAHHESPEPLNGKQRRDALASLDREFFARQCIDLASEGLPEYFRAVCEQPRVGFAPKARHDSGACPWYFAEIGKALIRFLDQWKTRGQARIAETVITREIFKWLGKGLATRLPLAIEGNSRFGKTEAVRTFAAMQPGAVRLVETPPSAGVGDLIREVARALGVDVPVRQQGHCLRETLEYVLIHSGLGLIFDEAQFLLPSNFSKNTAPARLNWLRRAAIDKSVPAAFIQTPQSYRSAKKRFVSATSYAMEQWDERILTRKLPDEIGEEDLLAIARIHFAGLPEKALRYVVNACVATQRNYVSDVAKIAALAKEAARDGGRREIKIEDVLAAIADVLPPASPLTPSSECGVEGSIGARVSGDRAEVVKASCKVRARSVRPAGMESDTDPAPRINFGSENPAGLIPASGG